MAQRSSYKKPWLYTEPQRAMQTTMEGEVYNEGAVEKQSQWKKPYKHQFHPESEWTFAGPGFGPHEWYPGFPSGADCEPRGDAIGGGKDPCDPGTECGQWTWNCAHRITKFSVIQSHGWIQSIKYGPNDTVIVTVCWDESIRSGGKHLGVLVTTATGAVFQTPDLVVDCLGPGHDDECTRCLDCPGDEFPPVITYSSQQMSINGTQNISASGGGGGPYQWSITGGSGTLSTTKTKSGQSTTFTAPASNPNCVNNPVITVTDYCGNTATLKIAVTAIDDSGTDAWGEGICLDPGTCTIIARFPFCHTEASVNYYNCNNTFRRSAGCGGGQVICGTIDSGCPCPNGCPVAGQKSCEEWLTTNCSDFAPSGTIKDLRSEGAKANGCCPAGLL